ncbi:MAG: hypothetical protein HY904_21450 [Deltaproteobacteria bacterium]|nr:hypothetical protein [Deltaproteobacteria bacterium]
MSTRPVASRLVALFLLAGSTACGGATGLAGALPSDDSISIRVPGASQQGQSSTSQGLLGAASDFYIHTYRISRFLNGHVVGLLAHIRWVTSQPPTTHQGDTYVWGPHTPGGLEPLTYRLTAEKLGEHTYSLVLHARPRSAQDESAFKAILEGTVQGSGQGDGRGKGDLVLHFDNAAAINPAVLERGDIIISFNALEEPRKVGVDFAQFQGADQGVPHDATYRYEEAADQSGSFLFAVEGNVNRADENRAALEVLTLRSRWLSSGAGRGDVTITGGDVEAQLGEAGMNGSSVQATECWGEDFTVVFQDTLPEQLREHIRPLQGDPALCAVTQASFPDPNM